MVKDMYEAILSDIGTALQLPDLHPDRNNSCLITFPNGLKVQIDMDRNGSFLVIGSDLGQVPLGRYRENIFREALKANGMPYPQHGILAYSTKTDHLIIFETYPMRDLTGERVADQMQIFMEKALHWKNSMEKGDIPVVGQMKTSMGMFGLRP